MDLTELDGVHGAQRARGHVVVIDVLRAFTCAAYAFDRGAAEIVLVATVEEALAERAARPGSLAMGEVGGRRPEGFDLGNSPAEIVRADLAGRTLVQRTGCGTQGVVAAAQADAVFAASLVNASATARHLRAAGAERISVVAMGSSRGPDGPEDVACRELIAARLRREEPDLARIAGVVAACPAADELRDASRGIGCAEDVHLALEIDRFDFAMAVTRDAAGRPVARRVPVQILPSAATNLPSAAARVVARARLRRIETVRDFRLAAATLLDAGFESPELHSVRAAGDGPALDLVDLLARGVRGAGIDMDAESATVVELLACADAAASGSMTVREAAAEVMGLLRKPPRGGLDWLGALRGPGDGNPPAAPQRGTSDDAALRALTEMAARLRAASEPAR